MNEWIQKKRNYFVNMYKHTFVKTCFGQKNQEIQPPNRIIEIKLGFPFSFFYIFKQLLNLEGEATKYLKLKIKSPISILTSSTIIEYPSGCTMKLPTGSPHAAKQYWRKIRHSTSTVLAWMGKWFKAKKKNPKTTYCSYSTTKMG